MKKLIAILSLLLCLCLCFPVLAETASDPAVFTLSGNVLTLRYAEGTEPAFAFLSGDYTLIPAGDPVTSDGFTTADYVLEEAARSESQLFYAAVDFSGTGDDIRRAFLTTLKNGDFYCFGISRETRDFFIDCSEGYEYSEGRTLYIRLPGSPATGYEWNLIPDNSGILKLVDNYEIDMRENEEDPLLSGSGFFFLPTENPAGTEGSMLFTLDTAPEGIETGKTLEFSFTLDESGEIAEVHPVR